MFTIIILVLDWNPLDFSLIDPVGISKKTQNFVPFTNGGDGGGQGGGCSGGMLPELLYWRM